MLMSDLMPFPSPPTSPLAHLRARCSHRGASAETSSLSSFALPVKIAPGSGESKARRSGKSRLMLGPLEVLARESQVLCALLGIIMVSSTLFPYVHELT